MLFQRALGWVLGKNLDLFQRGCFCERQAEIQNFRHFDGRQDESAKGTFVGSKAVIVDVDGAFSGICMAYGAILMAVAVQQNNVQRLKGPTRAEDQKQGEAIQEIAKLSVLHELSAE